MADPPSPQSQEEVPVIHPPLEESHEQPAQPGKERVSRELKNLDSGLNGPAWECKGTHGRCLRVRTTGIQGEQEFNESSDNTRPIQDPKELENPRKRMDK